MDNPCWLTVGLAWAAANNAVNLLRLFLAPPVKQHILSLSVSTGIETPLFLQALRLAIQGEAPGSVELLWDEAFLQLKPPTTTAPPPILQSRYYSRVNWFNCLTAFFDCQDFRAGLSTFQLQILVRLLNNRICPRQLTLDLVRTSDRGEEHLCFSLPLLLEYLTTDQITQVIRSLRGWYDATSLDAGVMEVFLARGIDDRAVEIALEAACRLYPGWSDEESRVKWDVVELLVDYGVGMDQALCAAVRQCNGLFVRWLINIGADWQYLEDSVKLDAVARTSIGILYTLIVEEIVDIWELDIMVFYPIEDVRGLIVWDVLVEWREANPDCRKAFIDIDSMEEEQGTDTISALIKHLVSQGNTAHLSLLLDRLSRTNHPALTPTLLSSSLIIASLHCYYTTCDLLLQNGADPSYNDFRCLKALYEYHHIDSSNYPPTSERYIRVAELLTTKSDYHPSEVDLRVLSQRATGHMFHCKFLTFILETRPPTLIEGLGVLAVLLQCPLRNITRDDVVRRGFGRVLEVLGRCGASPVDADPEVVGRWLGGCEAGLLRMVEEVLSPTQYDTA
ncbi:hypothetical protein HK097_009461 [Rhizophlyctis rosea]|uniref:Uncharacterized protein n=1 Tax=Rhizophlyctis rosea TaxID=64517 RepID=A0AAD5SAI2_9FUNG|nr:hypothetical protein HK097_009461 [Rhizophlyctis rosea]